MDSENSNKIIGYSLLIIGILLILFSVWQVYNIFTGSVQPYDLFNLNPVSVDLGKIAGTANPDMTQEIIGSDVFNKPLNYTAFVILMGFVSSVGFKLATLGIYLVRTIKVNLKTEASSAKPL